MKTPKIVLVAVLIISGLLPLPVIFSSFFNPESAALMLNLEPLNTAIERLLIINGAYMLSFIVLFWIAAAGVIRANPSGILLSMILGIITLLRGVLVIYLFSQRQLAIPFLGYIAMIDGTVIIALTWMVKKI